jgi:DNA-binding CsgD family transcriptional regulator
VLDEFERPLPLTRREREVANLASEGLSSQAIADRLFVSVRTVEGHLHNAYGKLGVNERRGLSRLLKAGVDDT